MPTVVVSSYSQSGNYITTPHKKLACIVITVRMEENFPIVLLNHVFNW